MRHATPRQPERLETPPGDPFLVELTLRSGTTVAASVTWFRTVRNRAGGLHHIEWLDADGPSSFAFVDFAEIAAIVVRKSASGPASPEDA